MDKEIIRALEPTFTGNTRHLTEGEAGEILNDPDNQEELDALDELGDTDLPGLARYTPFFGTRNPGDGDSQ